MAASQYGAILALALSLGTNLWAEDSRRWRDHRGIAFDASLLEITTEGVVLQSTEFGDVFTIPATSLSEDDRSHLTEWRRLHPDPVLDPHHDLPPDEHAKLHEEVPPTVDTSAVPDNYTDPWPGVVGRDSAPEVSVIKEDPDQGEFTYQSDHYEIISDVRLNPALVKKFALLFEATREYCRALPLALKKSALTDQTEPLRIYIYESFGTYVNKGGPPSSAGVYLPARDIVLVPISSLGVKKLGRGYSYDWDKGDHTLPHELTHQLTDACYYAPGARGWFSEGLAEYIAATPYRSGRFNNKRILSSAKDFVTEYGRHGTGGRALGEDISLPFLENFFLQDYSDFTANGNFNYGVALLMTYYFFHMDRDGDRSAITSFLKALRNGAEGKDALKALLDGRSYDELQEEVTRAWRSRGIRLRFEASLTDS